MNDELKEEKEQSIKRKLDSPYVKGVHLDIASNLISIEFQNNIEVQIKFKRISDPRLDKISISPLGMSKLGATSIELIGSEADRNFLNFCHNIIFNSESNSFIEYCEYVMKKYRQEKEIL